MKNFTKILLVSVLLSCAHTEQKISTNPLDGQWRLLKVDCAEEAVENLGTKTFNLNDLLRRKNVFYLMTIDKTSMTVEQKNLPTGNLDDGFCTIKSKIKLAEIPTSEIKIVAEKNENEGTFRKSKTENACGVILSDPLPRSSSFQLIGNELTIYSTSERSAVSLCGTGQKKSNWIFERIF